MKTFESVKSFNIQLLEIAGFGGAFSALRLPFGKECRSYCGWNTETYEPVSGDDGFFLDGIRTSSMILIHEKDKALLSSLVKRGDEHAKVLRGILVWCKINAPRYWWQEMDRYRIGCECLSSNSTMHQQGKGLSEEELIEMKEALPESTMQERLWMFSYQTLRRIYFQRRNHRLPQWRTFCDWIKSLPFADEFITVE